jgi:hypothetical protein
MVPLPANTIRGMYSHMLKLLSFKGYLQEKGSLTIDPEGISYHISRRISRSNIFRGIMQPRFDYSDMHLFVMALFLSRLHVEAMNIILTFGQKLKSRY